MSLDDYLDHYIKAIPMLKFFGLALIGLIICIILIFLIDSIITIGVPKKNRNSVYNNKYLNTIERFYGVIFSGASILSFLGIYYLIDRFVEDSSFRPFWDAHKDFLLLVLIVISILFNNFLDRVVVPLKKISHEERSALRVAGMIYVILIFVYIKYIYENNNYDGFIMYFIGLMVGRFIYFDASFKDFLETMKKAILQIPVMVIGLLYTAIMCYFGFKWGYLLKSNGVLVSTFFAHLYMIVAIFIIHISRADTLFTRTKGR